MKRSKISSPGRNKGVFAAAGALCLAAAALSLCLGAAKLPLKTLWQAALAGPDSAAGAIFWYVRLPRTLGCLLAGAALALSGAVIQGVLDNPLASPGIIGVNAGAGLAVTLCCALGMLSGWAIAGAAFGGAMLAVGLVTFAAEKTGASRTT
ncbi:MAG: iron chelate uptake ABC transporter family permease subunit, partial [Clostridiales bacterium]|nr:iron chelate uptake ABC transporter family permease subunit [Clostridiales bacterium]